MFLAFKPTGHSGQTASPAERRLVESPQFLYAANHLLDAGKSLDHAAMMLQNKHHERFHRLLRRGVQPKDIQLARDVMIERVPDASLRFDMARWTLLLSVEFRRILGRELGENPHFDQEEARRITERFSSYLSERSFASGYCFKWSISVDDIRSSYALHPTSAAAEKSTQFYTPEAAIFNWCREVPYVPKDKSLVAYARYFGDEEHVEQLMQRCIKACDPELPSFMSEQEKAMAKEHGMDCFWHMVDFINWLEHHNPMDT